MELWTNLRRDDAELRVFVMAELGGTAAQRNAAFQRLFNESAMKRARLAQQKAEDTSAQMERVTAEAAVLDKLNTRAAAFEALEAGMPMPPMFSSTDEAVFNYYSGVDEGGSGCPADRPKGAFDEDAGAGDRVAFLLKVHIRQHITPALQRQGGAPPPAPEQPWYVRQWRRLAYAPQPTPLPLEWFRDPDTGRDIYRCPFCKPDALASLAEVGVHTENDYRRAAIYHWARNWGLSRPRYRWDSAAQDYVELPARPHFWNDEEYWRALGRIPRPRNPIRTRLARRVYMPARFGRDYVPPAPRPLVEAYVPPVPEATLRRLRPTVPRPPSPSMTWKRFLTDPVVFSAIFLFLFLVLVGVPLLAVAFYKAWNLISRLGQREVVFASEAVLGAALKSSISATAVGSTVGGVGTAIANATADAVATTTAAAGSIATAGFAELSRAQAIALLRPPHSPPIGASEAVLAAHRHII
jgi:hypothetical protein